MVECEVIPIRDSFFEEVSVPRDTPHGFMSDRGSDNESSSSFEEVMAHPSSTAGVSHVRTS